MTTYTFLPIEASTAAELRTQDDAGEVRKAYVDHDGGEHVRCCLRRSEPGESIMLVSYAPLRRWARTSGATPGPYEEVGPVFLHAEPCAGSTAGFPEAVIGARRVFRAYDDQGRILGGRLVDPAPQAAETVVRAALDDLFADEATSFVHVRAVEFGCFLAAVRPAISPSDVG